MSPQFALTRVEAVGDDRLEVEGTWSDVRGVRFVRPALVVRDADDHDRTLLATLDHKPWPAEDGRLWTAAFPWEGGAPDVASLQLAVTPAIVVPLAGEDAAGAEVVAKAPRREARARRGAGEERDVARAPAAEREAAARAERDAARASERLAAAREERDAARARVAEVERERDRLAAALDEARSADAARPSREALRAELRQRDEALAERAAACTEREAAIAARDAVVEERDALRRELQEREQAAEGAARRREAALQERDVARAELEHAARRAAERERERLAAVEQRLAAVEDERDRALAEPAGVAAPVPVQRVPREHEVESTRADWAARIAAILALLVLFVLFITFVRAIGA